MSGRRVQYIESLNIAQLAGVGADTFEAWAGGAATTSSDAIAIMQTLQLRLSIAQIKAALGGATPLATIISEWSA